MHNNVLTSEFSCEVTEGISDHKAVFFNIIIKRLSSRVRGTTVLDFRIVPGESVLDFLEHSYDKFITFTQGDRVDVNSLWQLYTKIPREGLSKLFQLKFKKRDRLILM